ncbi:MAG: type II toxin-antitoxin system ParD family antitoxin [Planctomycetota bacterium]|nr:MAG: type II toxin-antitoxin system ParD family antitoxin [Planctomycetota bacterium]
MSTLNISLPDEMREFIDREMAAGGYATASEYIRSLIRQAQREREQERLERLLVEGLESGEAIPVSEKFWGELVAEAVRRHRQRHDRAG